MTREEAKAWFKVLLKDEYAFNSADREAFAMAIKALEQEPCEDVIDRAEAMTEIMMFAGNVKSDEEDIYIKVSDAVQLLRELPPVNSQPKMGHWIMPQNDDGMSDPICYQVRCSECGFDLDPQTYCEELEREGANGYCPNCGAKMSEIPTGSEGSDKE